MQLRTTANGVAYRLRDATFTVTQSGATAPVATINSETDPDATSLQLTLASGGYSINVAPGWRLEKQIGASFQTVNAQLVSVNPTSFNIVSAQSTSVAYAFQTDGRVIVIGNGTLNLTIQVSDTSVTPGPGVWDAPSSRWDVSTWN
jgi:hypothetical protein